MTTKVSAGGATATYNNQDDKWNSDNKAFEEALNSCLEKDSPEYKPFPAGIAVDIAKENISDLKVLEMDKAPKYDPKAVY